MRTLEFYIQSSGETRVRASGYEQPAIVRVSECERLPNRLTGPMVFIEGGKVFATSHFSTVSQTVRWFDRTARIGRARLWEVTLDRLEEMERDASYPPNSVSMKRTRERNLRVIHLLTDIVAEASA